MSDIRLKRTDHGFRFGAAQHKVDIRVTKSGQMRVYLNGLECGATKGRFNG
jgi:hypothetical protein